MAMVEDIVDGMERSRRVSLDSKTEIDTNDGMGARCATRVNEPRR